MRYSNEVGDRALGLYAGHEHIEVSKDLLSDVVMQIVNNSEEDGYDDVQANDFAVAGLLKLFMETSNGLGLHRLEYDLQKLSVDYGVSSLK
jgi:hypothetical protein